MIPTNLIEHYIATCIHISICIYVRTYVYYACMHVHTYVHMYAATYMHTYHMYIPLNNVKAQEFISFCSCMHVDPVIERIGPCTCNHVATIPYQETWAYI